MSLLWYKVLFHQRWAFLAKLACIALKIVVNSLRPMIGDKCTRAIMLLSIKLTDLTHTQGWMPCDAIFKSPQYLCLLLITRV